VVERAVPAMSDALSVQPSSDHESSQATTNGPANDTRPIVTEAPNRARKSSGSTSAPARKVSTIEAN
jgi:hypothetical protein